MTKHVKKLRKVLTFTTQREISCYGVDNVMWTTSCGRLDMRSSLELWFFDFRSLTSTSSFSMLKVGISPSRRDHGRDRGEITARYGKSRRPKTRRDLAAILAEMREISAAKNAPRFSPRSQRDMEISAGKYAARCCSEIAARYGNLGGQNAP